MAAGNAASGALVAKSQYPLRWAASWQVVGKSWRFRRRSLNTLSGGQPLGSPYRSWKRSVRLRSQYPLRWAASWQMTPRLYHGATGSSQYPLRWAASWQKVDRKDHSDRHRSQYPLRWAASWQNCRTTGRPSRSSLNTLSGGQPLGRYGSPMGDEEPRVSIPSQVGSLLAEDGRLGVNCSQPSQYPLRWAASWQIARAVQGEGEVRLNNLSGGQPLGRSRTEADESGRHVVSIPSQVGSLLAVALSVVLGAFMLVSIPSQVGSLLAADGFVASRRLLKVSIPSQVGSLLAANGPALAGPVVMSQYPLRWAASWQRVAIGFLRR